MCMRITPPFCSLKSLGPLPFSRHRPSLTSISVATRNKRILRTVTAMAGATENVSAIVADDVKFGFQRSEMYKETLAGTVDPYDRHVFVCYKSPETWVPRVEDSDADPLPKLLASAARARRNEITIKTKFTFCGAGDGFEFSDGDVLIFPDMIKYRGVKESDVDSFIEDVIVGGKPWSAGVPEVLTGSRVFVCAHGSRDKRCGVCGPVLIDKLNEEIEMRGLKDQVFVSPCTHVGGHKYAGNVIIYSPDPEGKITGHWYGYVTPNDVPEILDQHIGKGEIIERLWRGQMSGHVEGGEKGEEQKLPNGKESKKSKKMHQESGDPSPKDTVASCCQSANGVSCCKDASPEQKSGSSVTGKLSSLMGTWEQSDFLAAVAVFGAVATIALAYSFYRRSG